MDAKPAMAAGVKVESSSSPSVKTETTAVKSEGPITLAEVHDFVANLGGTIPATDLTKHFKTRLIVSFWSSSLPTSVENACLVA